MNHPEFDKLQLIPMTSSDVPKVIEIELLAYAQPWTESIFHDCLRVGYSCWILKQNDTSQVIGYLILSIAADEMHILNLCINPEHQGMHLGTFLLKKAIKLGRRIHAESCFLEVRITNTTGIRLYLSQGFKRIGLRKNYYPSENGREDGVVMKKDLGLRTK